MQGEDAGGAFQGGIPRVPGLAEGHGRRSLPVVGMDDVRDPACVLARLQGRLAVEGEAAVVVVVGVAALVVDPGPSEHGGVVHEPGLHLRAVVALEKSAPDLAEAHVDAQGLAEGDPMARLVDAVVEGNADPHVVAGAGQRLGERTDHSGQTSRGNVGMGFRCDEQDLHGGGMET